MALSIGSMSFMPVTALIFAFEAIPSNPFLLQ
jgi:hypothetical protein